MGWLQFNVDVTEEFESPFMSTSDIIDTEVGCGNTFGAAGPLTYFRLPSDDCNGTVKASVGEGKFVGDD